MLVFYFVCKLMHNNIFASLPSCSSFSFYSPQCFWLCLFKWFLFYSICRLNWVRKTSSIMMMFFSLSLLSLDGLLDEPFQFDLSLFVHIYLIFLDIKASWSSLSGYSSNSSSEDVYALKALLCIDLEVDTEDFLVFCALRVRDFPFLIPLSCCSFSSWTFEVPASSSMDMESRFFTALRVVTRGLHFLNKLLNILSI